MPRMPADQPMSMSMPLVWVMELMLPREIRLVKGNERRRGRRRRVMVMLRAKHGCVLLVVLRRPRGRVRAVPPIPIVVELSGSFIRRRLRRLWGRHVHGCGEGAPVVPVGVAIRVVVLVYGCGMTRAGVVALLAMLLGKYGRMFQVRTSLWLEIFISLGGLSFPASFFRFVRTGATSSSSSSSSPSSIFPALEPEKSPGPRLSVSPSCCFRLSERTGQG